MFSNGSSNSTSLATVTPSFVTIGAPNFLSIITLQTKEDGIIFSRDNKIPLFLYDPNFPARYEQEVQDAAEYAVGSNPILSFDPSGVHIMREGYQMPDVWKSQIATPLGVEVVNAAPNQHRYPQMRISQDFIDALTNTGNPRLVRIGILRYMRGENTEHILARLNAPYSV